MDTALEVGTARAVPGERAKGHLRVAWLCDATPVEIPLLVINGASPGPCLWVQGGVHGDEYVGPMAIQDLASADPAEVVGALVLVPVVNILAFQAGSRAAPQDGLDMNRIWPGNPLEDAVHVYAHSELVVHELAGWMAPTADVVVDCHSGGWPHLMAPYARVIWSEDQRLSDRCRALARDSGLPLVWETPAALYEKRTPGALASYLHRQGVPAVTLEVGGQGRVSEADRRLLLGGLKDVARSLGVLGGEPEPPASQLVVQQGHWVRARRGGMLTPLVRPLGHVRRGQPIAVIRDLAGAVVEEVHSPCSGVVIGQRTIGRVNSGHYVANIGELEAG